MEERAILRGLCQRMACRFDSCRSHFRNIYGIGEMEAAPGLGSGVERRKSSSLLSRTKFMPLYANWKMRKYLKYFGWGFEFLQRHQIFAPVR